MLSTVTAWRPGEMWATMIVSEQLQPPLPPMIRLCPDLVSDPSSRMLSALLYVGGRWYLSAIAMWPMLSSLALTVKYSPSPPAVTMTASTMHVQRSSRERRDRLAPPFRRGGSGQPYPRAVISAFLSSAWTVRAVALWHPVGAVERAVAARDAGGDAAVVVGKRADRGARCGLRRRELAEVRSEYEVDRPGSQASHQLELDAGELGAQGPCRWQVSVSSVL